MIRQIKFYLWLIIPFILLLLPATYFDTGESVCLSQLVFDKECPACGITRGVQHAIHFNFNEAWEYNKLFVVILPVLIFVWFKTLIRLYGEMKFFNER